VSATNATTTFASSWAAGLLIEALGQTKFLCDQGPATTTHDEQRLVT
jgi:hypothetical protein